MTHYEAGRRVEYLIREHLEKDGYDVIRAAGSKGKGDLLAFKPGQMLVVQVKRSGKCGPAERAEVLRLASHIPGALALIASKPERQPIAFRRLTGPGPKDWTAWTSDEVNATQRRCAHTSPSPWGIAQCVLPDDHEERHAYSPSEALT